MTVGGVPIEWWGQGGCAGVAGLRLDGSILAHSCPAYHQDSRRFPHPHHAQQVTSSFYVATAFRRWGLVAHW